MLKNSGRFNFNNINQNFNKQSISVEEAYRILNLDPNKKYTKELEYLVSGHSLYYESKKGKFNNEINYWIDVLPETEKLFNYEKLSKHMTNNKNKICPIFIIGVPRCGSTLIEKVIASG